MNRHSISDSIAGVAGQPAPCPVCGAAARVTGGSCASCLLRAGLDDAEGGETESFEAVLAEVEFGETEWRLGNYQILEEIGRGGMGVIYRARQRHSKRVVALKRVLSYHGDSRDTLERFRREAEAAASLDHPNILPIYEVGETDGLPFFTMKYATGGSLQQAAPALSAQPRECVELMAKVTRAVAHAHGQGILHRDLKPGNILLDSRTQPLVTDFGLAKWIDISSDLTRSLAIFGTPGFIAPEQANGNATGLSPAADIYSLGAILFDLLTGRPPFLGEHALAVIRQAADTPAPKLRTIIASADRDLETICAKCLEREPQARYRSADELSEDLERWLEGRPIVARPVSPLTKAWRWSRRNPVLAGSLCACVLLGGLGGARQAQNQGLEAALSREQVAAHSIAVLPFLNLDSGEPDLQSSRQIAAALHQQLGKIGLASIQPLLETPLRWTGAGMKEEVQEAARLTGKRTVLAGTTRKVGDVTRHSIHLLQAAGPNLLGSWVFEVADGQSAAGVMQTSGIAESAYRLLGNSDLQTALAPDPAMGNDRARPFMISGRDFLVRRTIADLDRAIACFEGAVREEPRSASARSFLAMAYMGRDLLSSTPEMSAKALQNAREAIQLAPNDPTPRRAYAMVCHNQGRYEEGQEHALRALELGDQSERVFGSIGFHWRMRGRPDRAAAWYQKAKISQRQPADYDALLGDCYRDLGLDEAAQAAYESASIYQPNLAEGWIGLCHLRLLRGDIDGARAISHRELPKHPASPAASEMAALAEFFSRNFGEAERLYEALASGNPAGGGKVTFAGAVDYHSAIACMKMRRGEVRAAQELLELRIAAEVRHQAEVAGDGVSLYRLAAAEAVLGRTEEALNHLRAAFAAGWLDFRSLRMDPRFEKVAGTRAFDEIISDIESHVNVLKSQAELLR